MRYLNMLIGVVMLAFAAVQYNDPDGVLWAVYYLVRSTQGRRWLWASVAVWLGLVIFYWPAMPGFWRPEVFMVEVEGEVAREGMGLMIAWFTLLVVWFSARRSRAVCPTAAV
jgi:hypothetical protein